MSAIEETLERISVTPECGKGGGVPVETWPGLLVAVSDFCNEVNRQMLAAFVPLFPWLKGFELLIDPPKPPTPILDDFCTGCDTIHPASDMRFTAYGAYQCRDCAIGDKP